MKNEFFLNILIRIEDFSLIEFSGNYLLFLKIIEIKIAGFGIPIPNAKLLRKPRYSIALGIR